MSSEDQESREKRDSGAAPEGDTSEKQGPEASPDQEGPAASGEPRTAERNPTVAAGSPESNATPADPDTVEEAGAAASETAGSSASNGQASEQNEAGRLAKDAPDDRPGAPQTEPAAAVEDAKGSPSTATYYDDPYADYDYQRDDPYAKTGSGAGDTAVLETEGKSEGAAPPPAPPVSGDGGDDWGDDEEGMVRMSFLEHLEELRARILHSLYGLGIVYLGCLIFAKDLYQIIAGPFKGAVTGLPYEPPLQLVALTPMEQFHLIYIKIPLLVGIFLASPWLMYQAWKFIAPGLYKRERRWATPFVFTTASLFVLGGLFGYFVALRYALAFLIGIGMDTDIRPMISIDAYFNMFVAVMLGLGLVFQMPVLIFFLTLLGIVTPGFLLSNVRYAILVIFVLAAIITPTPDVYNMILFAVPMILLFYVGIGASYILVLKRESRRFPWGWLALAILAVAALTAGIGYYMHSELGYQFVREFPWLVRP